MTLTHEPAAGTGWRVSRRSQLTIPIVTGVGRGPTTLGAFDAALRSAGIADRNLIVLSSVIPPASDVVVADHAIPPPGDWGDRLYVVMAELRTVTRHEELAVGVGWVQTEDDRRGLFAEHVGHTEEEVRRDINATLDTMGTARPERFGPPAMVVRSAVCGDEPTAVLVAAVYDAAPWDEPGSTR